LVKGVYVVTRIYHSYLFGCCVVIIRSY